MTETEYHSLTIPFGKHFGVRLVNLPVSYVKWLANENVPAWTNYARAELRRRGTVTPTVEVSGHAIDRASLLCRVIWHRHYDGREKCGLHAWLVEIAEAAIKRDGEPKEGEVKKYKVAGVKLAIRGGHLYKTVLTCLPGKRTT